VSGPGQRSPNNHEGPLRGRTGNGRLRGRASAQRR